MYEEDGILKDQDEMFNERPSDRLRSERKNRQTKKNDFLTRMIAVQLLVCAIPISALAFMKKSMPKQFGEIKSSYESIMQTDMSIKEVFAAIGEFGRFPKGADAEANENAESLGVGGDDIAVYAPAVGTSFSPFYISAPICVPVCGAISSGFGYRMNPVTGIWSFHTGVDIAADSGENIKAAYYGIVEETGYDNTSGNYIVLRHSDGVKTRYLHCSKIIAHEGDVIRSGETIALVGSTGRSTGPHLHFTVEVGGVKVNPMYIPEINEFKA